MSTRQELLNADHFEMINHENADGTPVRWRRNGKNKLWKRDKNRFQIPVKHGLYDYGYIDQDNEHEFVVAE